MNRGRGKPTGGVHLSVAAKGKRGVRLSGLQGRGGARPFGLGGSRGPRMGRMGLADSAWLAS